MRTGGSGREQSWLVRHAGLVLTMMAALGCGQAGDAIDRKLTEEARKSLFQKKVDVKNRPAARSRAGSQGLKAQGKQPSS
jgi:hypothetical protein